MRTHVVKNVGFMPTSRGTCNRCPEPLGVGMRFIAAILEALGPDINEDTRYLGYYDRLNSSAFSQVAVSRFGDVLMLWLPPEPLQSSR